MWTLHILKINDFFFLALAGLRITEGSLKNTYVYISGKDENSIYLEKMKTLYIWKRWKLYISGKDENSNSKQYMHLSVHCSTVYNSQDTEAT